MTLTEVDRVHNFTTKYRYSLSINTSKINLVKIVKLLKYLLEKVLKFAQFIQDSETN